MAVQPEHEDWPPPPMSQRNVGYAVGYGVGYGVGNGVGYGVGDGVGYTMPPKQPSDEML